MEWNRDYGEGSDFVMLHSWKPITDTLANHGDLNKNLKVNK